MHYPLEIDGLAVMTNSFPLELFSRKPIRAQVEQKAWEYVPPGHYWVNIRRPVRFLGLRGQ